MFFLSVTNSSISKNFLSSNLQELRVNSLFLTVMTDDFSKLVTEPDGFSVLETSLDSTDFFSKIVYDNKNNTIKVVKSTLSGMPIYYKAEPNGNFFCSSSISMLREAGVEIEENTSILPEYFVYFYVSPPDTLYLGIRRLSSGSYLLLELKESRCDIKHVKCFAFPEKKQEIHDSMDAISKQVSEHLSKVIRGLEENKDEITLLLSGGLDSSILFKLLEKFWDIGATYSSGYSFENPKTNFEKKYALSAKEYFKTDHMYFEPSTEDFLIGLIEGIQIAEEPITPQWVLFHLLFKDAIPGDHKIILCGQGADIVFGSYRHDLLFEVRNNWGYRLIQNETIIRILRIAQHITGNESLKRKLNKLQRLKDDQIWALDVYADMDWACEYYKVSEEEINKNRLKIIELYKDYSIYDVISILNFFGHLCISKSIISKLAEKQGKIIIYPYNETEIIRFSLSLPWEIKPFKNILRHVARQLGIPEFIITRPKSGIQIRRKDRAEKGGPFEPLVALASEIFDEEHIRGMQSSDPYKAMTFWCILSYSIWKRLCIDMENPASLINELNESIRINKKE